MKNSSNKSEGKNKTFLKSQIYNISWNIRRALEKFSDEKTWWDNEISQISRRGNDHIKEILEEKSDLFAKRAIVWDIHSYTRNIGWNIKQITQFKCKYWLWITVDNLNSFLDFCAIHGFIPMVDKIYIEWQDISQIRELYNFFAFVISNPSNPLIRHSLLNEIEKLDKMFQWPSKEVLEYLQHIVDYTTSIYQYLLWNTLWKVKNVSAMSENIFVEIAIRLENQIRQKIWKFWIESSYLKLAWYTDDHQDKTDMHFILKKTRHQSYQVIPMQFTVGSAKGGEKERKIENYLIEKINKWSLRRSNFLLFFVNWEFWRHISHSGKKNEGALNEKYNDWVNNPREREKIVWGNNQFPLFIDSIDFEIIKPAEVMYIALHMLYESFNFKYTTKDTYFDAFKKFEKRGSIQKSNRWEITHWETNDVIKLSDISIEDCSIEKITNPRPNYPWILKHKFSISYQWESMWIIIIYEVEQKTK